MKPEATRTLLLIETDPAQHRIAASAAARAGWRVEAASADADSVPEGAAALLVGHWREKSAELIGRLRAERPLLPILACGERSLSAGAIRAGASDFLVEPLAAGPLLRALAAAADRRRGGELRPLAEKNSLPLAFDEIIGSSPAFRAALAVAAKAARSRVPVLIEGERGTGKEMVAQAIHASGPRGARPLIVTDCGAVIPDLLDSWLFGHEKGAFPGAFDRHVGRIEAADGATLFLDNVEELPLDIQQKLLAAVERGEVWRMGGRGFKAVDVRIIAASNRPLADEVAHGRFREDLYCRLAAVTVSLPPLRDRRADIPALARAFLARFARQPGLGPLGITDDALDLLMSFGWPGNVRQLENALFLAALACNGPALTSLDFPRIALEAKLGRRADDHHAREPRVPALAHGPGITLYRPDGNLRPLEEIEADVIRLAIGHYQGRMTEVARRLGIGRSTLYRKLAELGMVDAA
ncbi:MAG TPA: sigma-54 dependent transcriptional regulator [Allosphingosinicella sp.]|nr:sigma-54 dependent transcriptional regulator [Allosphingosinicella sp.]